DVSSGRCGRLLDVAEGRGQLALVILLKPAGVGNLIGIPRRLFAGPQRRIVRMLSGYDGRLAIGRVGLAFALELLDGVQALADFLLVDCAAAWFGFAGRLVPVL